MGEDRGRGGEARIQGNEQKGQCKELSSKRRREAFNFRDPLFSSFGRTSHHAGRLSLAHAPVPDLPVDRD